MIPRLLSRPSARSKIVSASPASRKNTTKLTQVGICGEHGGEPDSVQFFHSLDFDYVSCSPFRVPIARIAAGQAAASESLKKEADKLYRESITNLKRKGKKSD